MPFYDVSPLTFTKLLDSDIATFARACGHEVIEGWQLLAPRLDEVVAATTMTNGKS